VSFILISKPKLTLLANNNSIRFQQLKPVFHFTISRRPALNYIKTSFPVHFLLYIHYSDSPFNIRAYSPRLGYILIYVGQSYSSVGHQYTRVGQTINLSFTSVGQNVRWFPLHVGQFHEWVGQCP
jgi:hypothetical protein